MLNWQKISDAIKVAETLDPTEYETYLTGLTAEFPEIAKQVSQIISRNQAARSFMMTSVGDYLPMSDPEYSVDSIIDVWQIISVLGSGGMGDVYKARRNDGLYEQIVALKVMRGGSEARKAHFQSERQRLAGLNHPGIASIIDGGTTDDGQPYMAMEFVDGVPIADYVTSQGLSIAQRLGLFTHVCRAISHAHSNLVLHRDIKSDNILVDKEGRIRLIDFGIATLLDEGADAESGPFTLGTAAPEQLTGQRISAQTDIFALGALLHQLVTHNVPNRMPDGSMTLSLEALKDKDLSAVIRRAMATNPQDRYLTSHKLEAEIDAILTQKPVEARQGGGLYKLSKFIRRAPVATALSMAFIAALIIGMGTTSYFAGEARQEANRASEEAQRANNELTRAEWNIGLTQVEASISSAYADAFRYAFGTDEDMEKLSDRLLVYAEESLADNRDKNAEAAAVKIYAVGKHFLSRNDYVSARKVLEPWVTEGFGSPQLLNYGQANLGHAYRNLGESELAGNMFRKAEAFFPGTPSENSLNHASNAAQAALFSDDDATTDKARKIIDHILAEDDRAYVQMYLLAQIYQMESKRGEWDASYDALSRSVSIIESGKIGENAGMDTMRLNLAQYDIYHRNDFVPAIRQIDIVQNITDTKKGESKELGRIHELRAVMAWAEKDYSAANAHLNKALPLYEKYTGKNGSYISAIAQQGIVQADAGNFESARQNLAILKTDLSEKSASWPDMLRLYIQYRETDLERAQALYDSSEIDSLKLRKNLKQTYYLKALEKDGLKL